MFGNIEDNVNEICEIIQESINMIEQGTAAGIVLQQQIIERVTSVHNLPSFVGEAIMLATINIPTDMHEKHPQAFHQLVVHIGDLIAVLWNHRASKAHDSKEMLRAMVSRFEFTFDE